jgi:hypothetical protein
MKKQDIYNRIVGGYESYEGTVYLACCIGVEYDYDIVSHFIKYYKDIGVDEFLIVLNTDVPNSKKLKEVQNILRGYGIEEKQIWYEKYDFIKHTQILMDLIESQVEEKEWVITVDIDEFQEYFCDLRKFISYLEKNHYEYAVGTFVDRISIGGDIVKINNDTDLFETFPVRTKLTKDIMYSNRNFIQKVVIHKSYIKLDFGQHRCIEEEEKKYRSCKHLIDVHHFKWRGDLIQNTIDRIEMFKINNLGSRQLQSFLDFYEKNGSLIADE